MRVSNFFSVVYTIILKKILATYFWRKLSGIPSYSSSSSKQVAFFLTSGSRERDLVCVMVSVEASSGTFLE